MWLTDEITPCRCTGVPNKAIYIAYNMNHVKFSSNLYGQLRKLADQSLHGFGVSFCIVIITFISLWNWFYCDSWDFFFTILPQIWDLSCYKTQNIYYNAVVLFTRWPLGRHTTFHFVLKIQSFTCCALLKHLMQAQKFPSLNQENISA